MMKENLSVSYTKTKKCSQKLGFEVVAIARFSLPHGRSLPVQCEAAVGGDYHYINGEWELR